MHGGVRKNSGRKPGSTGAKTQERLSKVDAVMAAVESALPEAFKGDAHAFLIAVYKDTRQALKDRLAAATAAISYEKPKLASMTLDGNLNFTRHEEALAEINASIGQEAHGQPN